MTRLADFDGTYVAAGAGFARPGGGAAVYLRNQHGVVIKFIAPALGPKLKLSADGVNVTLAN